DPNCNSQFQGGFAIPYAPEHLTRFLSTGFADASGLEGHGTGVTSVIATLNNGGGPLSGALNSVLKPGEDPYHVTVFGGVNDGAPMLRVQQAIAQVARGNFQVANLSWNALSKPGSTEYASDKHAFKDKLMLLSGKTLLVVSAGNEGLDVKASLPAAL